MASRVQENTVLPKSLPLTAVLLVGAYILCQAVADVCAVRPTQIGNIIFPSATMIYAATLTLRDLIHRQYGARTAIYVIVSAGAFNVLQALYFTWTIHLPAPAWFDHTEAWASLFGVVPAITVASIIAEVVSQLADTGAYSLWDLLPVKTPLWSYVIVSNLVGLIIDSVLFIFLAFTIFSKTVSFPDAWQLAQGQMLVKGIITLATAPLIYTIRK